MIVRFLSLTALIVGPSLVFGQAEPVAPSSAKASIQTPINALVITGGCCHDYEFQAKAMQLAAKDRGLNVNWTIVNEGGKGTEAKIALYDREDWAAGFDVVIHNECFANTTDPDYIRKITKAHAAGANAIVIHCAMHTYRAATIDDWREFLGVTSRKHDHQSHYPVRVVEVNHPIMKDFSTSEKTNDDHPVFWVNQYGKARVFGTTYGHSNETFSDKVFLDTFVRALQWVCEKR
jgi:uncharacterized protein